MKKSSLVFTASIGALALGACSSVGVQRQAPDEFKVVTKAPLSVPPEYSLRPPAPGQAQPAEVVATSDRALSFGQDLGVNASASEKLLVQSAGAIAVNPIIRSQLDFEEAGIIRKNSSFAERVIGWTGNEEEREVVQSDSATGGESITIESSSSPTVKLPGT